MKENKNIFKYKFYPILILIITIFMSVGYASINSVILGINGNAVAMAQEGVYITEVNYISDVNANLNNSKIISAYQTNLNSLIYLSSSDKNSSITYEIVVYNSSEDAYRFDSVKYIVGADTYDNTNIEFTLDGLKENDILYSKKYLRFKITFSYVDSVLSSNHDLKSLLNFNFVDIAIWNLGGVSGEYELDMDAKVINNYVNLDEGDFFFEPTSIPVPSVSQGDMYFSKEYDPSTGKFTFKRTSLEESSPIEVKGNVYAVTKPVELLGKYTGDYTITINCKSVPNYQEKTANDFLLDLTQIYFPSTCYGTMYFSKSYNASTGVLTLKRTSINGAGLIKWFVNIYYLAE